MDHSTNDSIFGRNVGIISLLITAAILLHSCASTDSFSGNFLQKRKYTKGWSWNLKGAFAHETTKDLDSTSREIKNNPIPTLEKQVKASVENSPDVQLKVQSTVNNVETALITDEEKSLQVEWRTINRSSSSTYDQIDAADEPDDEATKRKKNNGVFELILGLMFTVTGGLGTIVLLILGGEALAFLPFAFLLIGVFFLTRGIRQIRESKGKVIQPNKDAKVNIFALVGFCMFFFSFVFTVAEAFILLYGFLFIGLGFCIFAYFQMRKNPNYRAKWLATIPIWTAIICAAFLPVLIIMANNSW